MEDSTIDSLELEQGTTTNVPKVAEQVEPATEAVEASESKSTVRDAVLKAFEKTAKDETPPETERVEPVRETDPITGRELEPIRAPATMTPSLREKWGTVPRDMQKFWVDRERDMQIKNQDTAEERKLAKEFQQTVAPYESTFRQFNTNALAHTKELLNVDHQLRNGSGAEKARIIHSLITHFQPDAQTLTALFNGQQMPAPQAAQQAPNVQEAVRQEFAAREEASATADAEREMEAFRSDSQNEFFDDLKPIMLRAIQGGFIADGPLKEVFRNAYDFAVTQHPEIKQILASRTTASSVAATQTARPVQSVKPSLASGGGGGNVQPRPQSLRDAVDMAWDKHSR